MHSYVLSINPSQKKNDNISLLVLIVLNFIIISKNMERSVV